MLPARRRNDYRERAVGRPRTSRNHPWTAGPLVEIAVSDQRIGIPPEAQGRVFEKFFRADPNLSRGVGGTGLGLYIAKELVDRMDGQITLDSSPARGHHVHRSAAAPPNHGGIETSVVP